MNRVWQATEMGDGDILRTARRRRRTSGRLGMCKRWTRSVNDVAVQKVEVSGGLHVRKESEDDEKY
jgi:hypothetical protein